MNNKGADLQKALDWQSSVGRCGLGGALWIRCRAGPPKVKLTMCQSD